MADNTKDQIDMADLAVNLPAAAAGRSSEDRAGLVDALKHKLKSLDVQHVDRLESLTPNVRCCVEALQELQSQHDEIEAKFFEERATLEAKYQKLYEPLYSERHDIVNGVVEVDEVTEETATDQEQEKAPEEKGVPNFWLKAMKNHQVVSEEITERDEEALKYLKDIKWARIDDPKGFKLEFFFDTNPYFKNTVLTKIYHMIDENDPILEKAIGTEIEWHPGKCLTQKVLKKKPTKGSKNSKVVTKTEECESFFNFFNPPQVPDEEDDLDDDSADELEALMEQDYEVGIAIRDKIIPHAVSWFTGEAAPDDDDDDDDTDDDTDEDVDEDKPREIYRSRARREDPDLDLDSVEPLECKQQ